MTTHDAVPRRRAAPAPSRPRARRNRCVLAFLAGVALACGPALNDPGGTVADPEGTRTTTINFTIQPHPIVLYQGVADDGPYGTHAYVQVLTGVDASLNVHFTSVTSSDPEFRDHYLLNGNQGGEVVALGPVAGLGTIAAKPEAGWGPLASAEPGSGYVLRFKHARSFEADLPVTHARLYVVEWLTNTSGGIMGARVKYQMPF
jgi:hypothetical protein